MINWNDPKYGNDIFECNIKWIKKEHYNVDDYESIFMLNTNLKKLEDEKELEMFRTAVEKESPYELTGPLSTLTVRIIDKQNIFGMDLKNDRDYPFTIDDPKDVIWIDLECEILDPWAANFGFKEDPYKITIRVENNLVPYVKEEFCNVGDVVTLLVDSEDYGFINRMVKIIVFEDKRFEKYYCLSGTQFLSIPEYKRDIEILPPKGKNDEIVQGVY